MRAEQKRIPKKEVCLRGDAMGAARGLDGERAVEEPAHLRRLAVAAYVREPEFARRKPASRKLD